MTTWRLTKYTNAVIKKKNIVYELILVQVVVMSIILSTMGYF